MAGGIVVWLAGKKFDILCRWLTAVFIFADLVIIMYLWTSGSQDMAGTGWLVDFNRPWIRRFNINLHFGIDGLSLVLLALTYIIGILSVFISWTEIRFRTGFFHFNILWILAGITGVFMALDLFLFYFFWEMMLIPMYFMIGIWGHERKIYSALKFFIFTQASGLFMLASIIGLYFLSGSATGVNTFDIIALTENPVSGGISWLIMAGFLAGFLVKLPAFPFHSWLPDAHTDAPTAGSLILAGLMLKTGAYGLLRIVVPLFPETVPLVAPYIAIAGVAGIVYGAKLAYAQKDLKRMVAYTSVSHMGFIMVGVFALNELAFQGVVMQIVAHALSTGALFIVAGMLQERNHTRKIDDFGGLWHQAPAMGGVTLIFAVASLGLPGMANFIAEFLILLGSFQSNIIIAVIATAGLIVSVPYSLKLFQRTFHENISHDRKMADLNLREMIVMLVMILFLFWLGLYPRTIFSLTNKPVVKMLRYYEQNTGNADNQGGNAFIIQGIQKQ